jgi:hypothetical protein
MKNRYENDLTAPWLSQDDADCFGCYRVYGYYMLCQTTAGGIASAQQGTAGYLNAGDFRSQYHEQTSGRFSVLPGSISYTDAQAACLAKFPGGGGLASIHSKDEQVCPWPTATSIPSIVRASCS